MEVKSRKKILNFLLNVKKYTITKGVPNILFPHLCFFILPSLLTIKLQKIVEEIPEKKIASLPEGALKQITVNAYERNQEARKQCIDEYGYTCSVCGFDFENFYGKIGTEYIHVHHLKPLSKIKEKYKVDPIKDFRPVCPNCHSMIHKADYSVEQLRDAIGK